MVKKDMVDRYQQRPRSSGVNGSNFRNLGVNLKSFAPTDFWCLRSRGPGYQCKKNYFETFFDVLVGELLET